MVLFYILIFLISCFLLTFSGKWVVEALMRVSRFLGWKEFVVAFFAVSLGAVLPEFFIGISSAIHKIPLLSFGNIVGQNIILFSLAPALCVFILKGLEIESRTVRAGAVFAVIVAVLPLFLILDGQLSRIDGAILIASFFFYIFWLFSKKERFTKIYDDGRQKQVIKKFSRFLKDIAVILGGFLLIILSAQGIINSAVVFSKSLQISLPLIGILIIGAGTALPETYFAITLARKSQSWMILGGLMGAVAVSSTLVLGIIVLISPIKNIDFSPFVIARIFLIISSIFFLIAVRTEQKLTKKEALVLLIIYIFFLFAELFFQ